MVEDKGKLKEYWVNETHEGRDGYEHSVTSGHALRRLQHGHANVATI